MTSHLLASGGMASCCAELTLRQWTKYGYAEAPERWDARNVPRDMVKRIHVDSVSRREFVRRFERPGVPVVIQGVTRKWAANRRWTPKRLKKKYGSERFKCGEDDKGDAVKMKLRYYMRYYQDTPPDDSPL